jgi:hypothetical protein
VGVKENNMSEPWHVILTIGIVIQIIIFMIKKEVDLPVGYTYAPTILTIGLLILFPLVRDILASPAGFAGELSTYQKFMLGIAFLQGLLIVLKITISPDMPWYLALLPILPYFMDGIYNPKKD